MVTKTGYIINLHCKLNGQEIDREYKTFQNLSQTSMLSEIIQGQTTINLEDININSREVLYCVTDDDFIANAAIRFKGAPVKRVEKKKEDNN